MNVRTNVKSKLIIFMLALLTSCGGDDHLIEYVSTYDLITFRSLDGVNHQMMGMNTSVNAFITFADTLYLPGAWMGNGLAKNQTDSLFFLLANHPQNGPGIFSISMNGEGVQGELDISPEAVYYGLEVDLQKELFYAISQDEEKHAVKIDPGTGQATQLTTNPLDFEFLATDDNTEFIYDQSIYALLASTDEGLKLITVSTQTGETLNSFPLDQEFKRIKYAIETGLLYTLIEDSLLNNHLGAINFTSGETSVIKEQLFFGESHGVDYDNERQSFAVIFYDGQSNLLVYSIPEHTITTLMTTDTLGLHTLNYR